MEENEFSSLEERFKSLFLSHGMRNKSLLLALSGGFDSILLLHLICQIRSSLSLKLYGMYVHHGKEDTQQGHYRDLAWLKVKEETSKNKVECFFHLYKGETEEEQGFKEERNKKNIKTHKTFKGSLLSEAFYRKVRYSILREKKNSLKADFIVLAHFLNDLLETRLIRLIRGTGREGLRAMTEKKADLFRPLLSFQREEFLDYAQAHRLSFIEDPSNQNLEILRNWLRRQVLPDLEKKRPGSLKSLARSLENVCEREEKKWNLNLYFVEESALSFPLFMELNEEKKVSLLFYYMRKMQMKNYNLNHAKEILKRLSAPRKDMQFPLLKHIWQINSSSIKATPLKSDSFTT